MWIIPKDPFTAKERKRQNDFAFVNNYNAFYCSDQFPLKIGREIAPLQCKWTLSKLCRASIPLWSASAEWTCNHDNDKERNVLPVSPLSGLTVRAKIAYGRHSHQQFHWLDWLCTSGWRSHTNQVFITARQQCCGGRCFQSCVSVCSWWFPCDHYPWCIKIQFRGLNKYRNLDYLQIYLLIWRQTSIADFDHSHHNLIIILKVVALKPNKNEIN